MAGKSYRNMGTHAVNVTVGDTVPPVGPGEFVDLSADDETNNKELIDEGVLLDMEAYQKELEEVQAKADAEQAKAEEEAQAEAKKAEEDQAKVDAEAKDTTTKAKGGSK